MDVADFFDAVYRRYERYWWREPLRYSLDPSDHVQSAMTARLLRVLARRPPGRALDVGAGEGADSIRLALLGYEVDAVDASAVASEKIERFARRARVRVNVLNADVLATELRDEYDVVLCNGVLHYIEDKAKLLRQLQGATAPGGVHAISLFTDYTPLPACHRVVDVFCDREDGVVNEAYRSWGRLAAWAERNKLETKHPGFEAHRHSFVKILAQKLGRDGDDGGGRIRTSVG
jgi:SAM-dependent methyltransferase